jgi:ankyrin repeat protein
MMGVDMKRVETRRERRKGLFAQNALGRTPLFYAAENGLEHEVREIIFSLRGTGLGPPRLALITTKDHSGLTAADVAEQNGHEDIASLLRVEQGRMEFFE